MGSIVFRSSDAARLFTRFDFSPMVLKEMRPTYSPTTPRKRHWVPRSDKRHGNIEKGAERRGVVGVLDYPTRETRHAQKQEGYTRIACDTQRSETDPGDDVGEQGHHVREVLSRPAFSTRW